MKKHLRQLNSAQLRELAALCAGMALLTVFAVALWRGWLEPKPPAHDGPKVWALELP